MTATPDVPPESIQSRIHAIRGQRVLVDRDLAAIYGVPTRQLNQAVKRNLAKFPEDFMFRLTQEETDALNLAECPNSDDQVRTKCRPQIVVSSKQSSLKSQTVISKIDRGGRRYLPYVFTEHGAIQAANILRSESAVAMSVQVVRAFVRLRELVINHKAIADKLAELDIRIGEHDEQLAAIIEAIRQLAEPVLPENRRRIGFNASTD